MEYTHLGRSGLKVSRLCLGTMNFGWVTPEDESHAIMDRSLEVGINFFDTANMYGGNGLTEEVIGRWFAKGNARREKTVIATKLYATMSEWPNESKLSALAIRRQCDASLKRLQTDHIDIYQMHHIDRDCPWDEIWQAMETLVSQGKILYSGSSNFAGWHIAQAQEAAKRRNYFGLSSEQSIYSLYKRQIELEVLPACEAYGLGVIPWSPLHHGLLGGVLQKAEKGRSAAGRAQEALDAGALPQVEAYEAFCKDLGENPADVGIAWLLHQPIVTAPIIGPRTIEQLNGTLRALDIVLDEKALNTLDQIWPGPGGTAPEAYAW